MPRRSVIVTSFLTLAVVVAITLKIWSLKLQVPLAVRTAQLTTEYIIDARSSDDNAENLRRVNVDTQSLSNIPVVSDSESPLTVTVSRTEQPASTTESVAVRNRHSTEKASEKLYAAMADPPSGCQEAHCMEYLTAAEKQAMKQCDDEIRKRLLRTPDDGSCNFMDGRQGRLPVALASSEGSGNTWVRGLLERASGICTGFGGCDYMMRGRGFIGEGIASGSVLVFKTHIAKPQWYRHQAVRKPKSSEKRFGSAIFILRNPYNSAVAEWNRVATNMIIIKQKIPHNESHTNVVASEYFTGEDIKFAMLETVFTLSCKRFHGHAWL